MHDRTTDLARFGVCACNDADDLAPARGIVLGVIAAGVWWVFVAMVVAIWWRIG